MTTYYCSTHRIILHGFVVMSGHKAFWKRKHVNCHISTR